MVRRGTSTLRELPDGLALRFPARHYDGATEFVGRERMCCPFLGMPRMDGGELAERAKALDANLIAMLMAVPGDPELGDLLSAYGDLPFVPKPVSFADLAEKLERLLGIPAQPTSPLRSMASARARERRRASGSHRR